jgi:hypothetical protein
MVLARAYKQNPGLGSGWISRANGVDDFSKSVMRKAVGSALIAPADLSQASDPSWPRKARKYPGAGDSLNAAIAAQGFPGS